MAARARLAGCWALAVLALAGCVPAGPRGPSGQLTVPATTDAFSIRVGDCAGKLPSDTTDRLALLPCGQPHHWEAFAAPSLTGEEFPGATALAEAADRLCAPEFERFVGLPEGRSSYRLTFLVPTSTTWVEAADRQVICLAGSPAGQITGTLRGVGK